MIVVIYSIRLHSDDNNKYWHPIYIYIKRESYATVIREVQNVFIFHVVSLIFEFKTPIRPLKVLFILKYVWRSNFTFLEKKFYFFSGWKCIEFMFFNKNNFLILKKIENIFNGRIDILNLKMGDTTQNTKIFCISRLTVA
jgi:hypothetical protein